MLPSASNINNDVMRRFITLMQQGKPKKLRGRARWHALVEGGRVLELQEATTMGQDPLAVYLRAMGVKLTREQQGDVEFMRNKVREKMMEMGVTQWSKS